MTVPLSDPFAALGHTAGTVPPPAVPVAPPVWNTAPFAVPTPMTPSPMAQELIAAGAIAGMPDYAAMLADLTAAMTRIKALEAERGIPSDPIDGAAKNLSAHVDARAAQLPAIDFSEIRNMLAYLPADSASVTPAHSELVKTAVHELVDTIKHAELGYIRDLATAFHKEVLKAAPPVPDLAAFAAQVTSQLAAIQTQLAALASRTAALETRSAPIVPAAPVPAPVQPAPGT